MVKRIISILSGAILPLVSLSFLDLLVDYIRKTFGVEDKKKDLEPEITSVNNNININEQILVEEKQNPIIEQVQEEQPIIEPESTPPQDQIKRIVYHRSNG